jgi:hypothetical protein
LSKPSSIEELPQASDPMVSFSFFSHINFKDVDNDKPALPSVEAVNIVTVARTDQSRNLLHTIQTLFPNRSHYQAQLHITFWSLSLYDIYVPKDRYDDEIKKIQGTNSLHFTNLH